MKRFLPIIVAGLTILVLGPLGLTGANGGFWDQALDIYKKASSAPPQETGAANYGLTNQELISGFKEALDLGVKRAVELASRPGGFLDNPQIHIPLPEKLQTGANLLRGVGLGSQVDALERSMNVAAERASAEALPIFTKAITEMTFEDAKKLWKGGDTAITDYFRTKTFDSLYQKFRPTVHETMSQVGVVQMYNSLLSNPMAKMAIANTDLDLDNYVTRKSLDGLFVLLAQQEKAIRKDPAARTTALLKKVFGF